VEYKNPTQTNCIICGAALHGRQRRFCSDECTKQHKREQMHLRRPLRDHICRCQTCGREMHVGRPRVEERHSAPAFVQAVPQTSQATQAREPAGPKADCTEVCKGSGTK
jgi:hypothetical protein